MRRRPAQIGDHFLQIDYRNCELNDQKSQHNGKDKNMSREGLRDGMSALTLMKTWQIESGIRELKQAQQDANALMRTEAQKREFDNQVYSNLVDQLRVANQNIEKGSLGSALIQLMAALRWVGNSYSGINDADIKLKIASLESKMREHARSILENENSYELCRQQMTGYLLHLKDTLSEGLAKPQEVFGATEIKPDDWVMCTHTIANFVERGCLYRILNMVPQNSSTNVSINRFLSAYPLGVLLEAEAGKNWALPFYLFSRNFFSLSNLPYPELRVFQDIISEKRVDQVFPAFAEKLKQLSSSALLDSGLDEDFLRSLVELPLAFVEKRRGRIPRDFPAPPNSPNPNYTIPITTVAVILIVVGLGLSLIAGFQMYPTFYAPNGDSVFYTPSDDIIASSKVELSWGIGLLLVSILYFIFVGIKSRRRKKDEPFFRQFYGVHFEKYFLATGSFTGDEVNWLDRRIKKAWNTHIKPKREKLISLTDSELEELFNSVKV
jgi:hypothetical protein